MAYPYRDERETRVLSAHFGDPEARTLEGWKQRGGAAITSTSASRPAQRSSRRW